MTLWEFVLIAAIVMAELLPACFPYQSEHIWGEGGCSDGGIGSKGSKLLTILSVSLNNKQLLILLPV